ncbi:MAG: hypothetical protein JNM09_27640 [Blastocatellia bacterium]|nr:hypothetical protein [Blastocatellia bacterium]
MNMRNNQSWLSEQGQKITQLVNYHLVGLAIAVALSHTVAAQTISTTAQLKQACENSPGNVVNITQPTKIEFGPALPTAETINTKCTIQIGPNAGFGVKQVAVNFAGPLVIQSSEKTNVAFEDAPWTAPSIAVNLTGDFAEFVSKQSRLRASAGNLSISLGATGKLELINPFGLTNPNGLEATGAVSLTAGTNFSGVLGDANIQAGTGISISMGGADSILKLDEASLNSNAGAISISGAGQKTNIEMSQGNYSAPAGVSVILPSADTGLKVKDGIFAGGNGSITLQSGGAAASFGNIEVNQSRFTTSSTVRITSGVGGKTIVDNVQLDGGQGVEVLSGTQGNSLVKNSRGTSATVRIAAGGGGVCLSDNNLFNAPVQNLCR